MMKSQLKRDVNLLVAYLNIMILSKAFQAKSSSLQSESSVSHRSEAELNEAADESIDDGTKSRTLNYQTPTIHGKATTYDADAEFSAYDEDEDSEEGKNVDQTQHQTPKYDLILFPKILELCLSFIIDAKKSQYLELASLNSDEAFEEFARKYSSFNKVSQTFLKRLIYLLETCNYNVQIMIYNNYRQLFIDLLAQKPACMLNTAQKNETVCDIVAYLVLLFLILISFMSIRTYRMRFRPIRSTSNWTGSLPSIASRSCFIRVRVT